MRLDGRVQRLACEQDGVFAASQALAVGATYRYLTQRVLDGSLRRVVRGGYVVAGVPVTWRRRVRALCLVVDDAVVAGPAAAALLGIEPFREGRIELAVPPGRRTSLARARQTSLRPCDIREVDGIPVTSPERTLVDLAAVAPRATLEVAVDSALRKGLLTIEELRLVPCELLCRGRKGAATLRAVIEDLGDRPIGAPSRELLALLEAAHVRLPVTEYPIRRADGRMAYLDGAYPDERIVIEIDDYATHSAPGAMDDERERQAEVSEVLRWWYWVRVTPRQIRRRPQWVVDKVSAALGLDPKDHRLPPRLRR